MIKTPMLKLTKFDLLSSHDHTCKMVGDAKIANKPKMSIERESWSPIEAVVKVKRTFFGQTKGCCKKTLRNTMFSSVFAKRCRNDKQGSRGTGKCHWDPIQKKWTKVFLLNKLDPFPVWHYYFCDRLILWPLCDSNAAQGHRSVMPYKTGLLYRLICVILCPIQC